MQQRPFKPPHQFLEASIAAAEARALAQASALLWSEGWLALLMGITARASQPQWLGCVAGVTVYHRATTRVNERGASA